jgi:hypothetical protein
MNKEFIIILFGPNHCQVTVLSILISFEALGVFNRPAFLKLSQGLLTILKRPNIDERT